MHAVKQMCVEQSLETYTVVDGSQKSR